MKNLDFVDDDTKREIAAIADELAEEEGTPLSRRLGYFDSEAAEIQAQRAAERGSKAIGEILDGLQGGKTLEDGSGPLYSREQISAAMAALLEKLRTPDPLELREKKLRAEELKVQCHEYLIATYPELANYHPQVIDTLMDVFNPADFENFKRKMRDISDLAVNAGSGTGFTVRRYPTDAFRSAFGLN